MNLFEELAAKRPPVKIIHGTDWWTDCDDVAALRLLCRAHKAGAVELLCICADAVMDKTAASISAFIKNEGIDVPIGLDFDFSADASGCKYQSTLAQYPHEVENSDCEDAYRLYRRALAQSDTKVDITEVGFPQNIQKLLESEADDISPLSGTELVAQKVNKIWMMAGDWSHENGIEYNLTANPAAREAAHYICANCPVPITFLGFEIGNTVITGSKLPEDDMVKVAFDVHGSKNGRSSWDPMLVLLAIINNEEDAGYTAVKGTARADKDTGANNFEIGDGRHTYVVKKFDDSYYADAIDSLLACI